MYRGWSNTRANAALSFLAFLKDQCKTAELQYKAYMSLCLAGVKANGGCLDVDVSRVQSSRPQSSARCQRSQAFMSTCTGAKVEIVI